MFQFEATAAKNIHARQLSQYPRTKFTYIMYAIGVFKGQR